MLKRRKFPRVKASWALEYRTVSDPAFAVSPMASLAVDISGGGICLEAKQDLARGAMLAIDLHSPEFDTPILALARVAWCQKRLFSDVYDVGAEFLWISWADTSAQARIAEYVKNSLPHDAASEG